MLFSDVLASVFFLYFLVSLDSVDYHQTGVFARSSHSVSYCPSSTPALRISNPLHIWVARHCEEENCRRCKSYSHNLVYGKSNSLFCHNKLASNLNSQSTSDRNSISVSFDIPPLFLKLYLIFQVFIHAKVKVSGTGEREEDLSLELSENHWNPLRCPHSSWFLADESSTLFILPRDLLQSVYRSVALWAIYSF